MSLALEAAAALASGSQRRHGGGGEGGGEEGEEEEDRSAPPEMPAALRALMKPGGAPWGTFDQLDVFDLVRAIRDPEHPQFTLEQLGVVAPADVLVVVDFYRAAAAGLPHAGGDGAASAGGKIAAAGGRRTSEIWVELTFRPTVAGCHLATTIGLCLVERLRASLPRDSVKTKVWIPAQYHSDAEAVNKQINDKERRHAAMEVAEMRDLVERCCGDAGS